VKVNLVPRYDSLAFNEQALRSRAYRQEILGANLANADTPNFKARDVNFADLLKQQLAGTEPTWQRLRLAVTDRAHFMSKGGAAYESPELLYRQPIQPSLDGNTVDADVERSHFAQNSIMTQAAIEFFGSSIKSRIQAFTGQPGQ
jgi:flagellar basal-body rod protein FlgB